MHRGNGTGKKNQCYLPHFFLFVLSNSSLRTCLWVKVVYLAFEKLPLQGKFMRWIFSTIYLLTMNNGEDDVSDREDIHLLFHNWNKRITIVLTFLMLYFGIWLKATAMSNWRCSTQPPLAVVASGQPPRFTCEFLTKSKLPPKEVVWLPRKLPYHNLRWHQNTRTCACTHTQGANCKFQFLICLHRM